MGNQYEDALNKQEAAEAAAKLDKEMKAPTAGEVAARAAVEARKQEESNRMAHELMSDEEESDAEDAAAAEKARGDAAVA